MRFLVCLALVTACSKSGPPTCEHAIAGAVDRVAANTAKDAQSTIAKIAPMMKQALTEACTQDKWPQSVISCIDGAKSQKELSQCDHQLSPQQRQSERARMDKVLANAVDTTQPGVAPAPTMDTGSAGSNGLPPGHP